MNTRKYVKIAFYIINLKFNLMINFIYLFNEGKQRIEIIIFRFLYERSFLIVYVHGVLHHEPLNDLDSWLVRKFWKRRFLKDISNSFHRVTRYGLKPLQFFSFKNISTNAVARGIISFGQNGPWLAGQLSNCQNFCVKSSQTYV